MNPCAPVGGVDQCVRQLILGTGDQGLQYEGSVVTRITVATAGAVGAAFAPIDALNQFTSIEFLYLVSTARIRLRSTRPDLTTTDSPDIEGIQIYQFPRAPNSPTAIEVSGVATLDIIAAGRVSA